jgi:hypothetical protein
MAQPGSQQGIKGDSAIIVKINSGMALGAGALVMSHFGAIELGLSAGIAFSGLESALWPWCSLCGGESPA